MPSQPEVFLRDLEKASDEAEARLTLALTVYLAAHSEEEDQDDASLLIWLASLIPGFAVIVLDLMERHGPGGRLSEIERARISADAVRVALAAFRQAGRTDPRLLSGSGDVSRATRIRHLATSIITAVRSEVQQAVAQSLGFLMKTWRTRLDAKVRVAHRLLEGRSVSIDGRFVTLGGSLRFPGDPEAPPQLTINCRCELAYSYNEGQLAA